MQIPILFRSNCYCTFVGLTFDWPWKSEEITISNFTTLSNNANTTMLFNTLFIRHAKFDGNIWPSYGDTFWSDLREMLMQSHFTTEALFQRGNKNWENQHKCSPPENNSHGGAHVKHAMTLHTWQAFVVFAFWSRLINGFFPSLLSNLEQEKGLKYYF